MGLRLCSPSLYILGLKFHKWRLQTQAASEPYLGRMWCPRPQTLGMARGHTSHSLKAMRLAVGTAHSTLACAHLARHSGAASYHFLSHVDRVGNTSSSLVLASGFAVLSVHGSSWVASDPLGQGCGEHSHSGQCQLLGF